MKIPHQKISIFFQSPDFLSQDGTLQVLALGELEKRQGQHWTMVKVGELQEGEMVAVLPWLERLGRSMARSGTLEVQTISRAYLRSRGPSISTGKMVCWG